MKVSDVQTRLINELTNTIPDSEPKIVTYNDETTNGNLTNGLISYLPTLAVGKLHYVKEQIHILIGERKEKA